MNFDAMSANELVNLLEHDAVNGSGEKDAWSHRTHLILLLRAAVIREASVGVGTVRRAGDAPLPDAPQMFVPWETKDGDYDLIPKETT